jgi:DNA modification methylase
LTFGDITPTKVKIETHESNSFNSHDFTGIYYNCDVQRWIDDISGKYDGSVQMIYLDPPFMTGQDYYYSQRVGSDGWKGDRTSIIKHLAYKDARYCEKKSFLSMISSVLETAYRLLTDEGSIYVHVDYRLSPYIKIMMDDIFGEENFLNEIIWQYNSGGRSTKHFSRKHDNILFYRKTERHYFNIKESATLRGSTRRNNMKKGIDEQGKVFYSIKSAGREYRYYEDEYINPGDVWSDISHLQQKDPERTGYDTQKPEKLIERILKVSTRAGDLVMDLFVGSGTLPAVAQKYGRNWVGVDSSVFSLHSSRKRLINTRDGNGSFKLAFYHNETFCEPSTINIPQIECFLLNNGQLEIKLKQYTSDCSKLSLCPDKLQNGLQLLDYWAVGYLDGGIFKAITRETRTIKHPDLTGVLKIEAIEGKTIAIQIVDVFGKQEFFTLNA